MGIRLHCSLLLLVLLVGCAHRNDPTLDLMQSEMRWLEDQVYMLESELEQTCYDLCKCKQTSRDQMIWQQATASSGAQAGSNISAPIVSAGQPLSAPQSTFEHAVEAPVVEPGVEPPRLDFPVADPGVIETQVPYQGVPNQGVPNQGVPLNSLPYEIVPGDSYPAGDSYSTGDSYSNDCPDCEPGVNDPAVNYDNGMGYVPPIVSGNDNSTIDAPAIPDEVQPTPMSPPDSPSELPAPLGRTQEEATPPTPDELGSGLEPDSGFGQDSSFEPATDLMTPDQPMDEGDGGEFMPEPALPPAGERPSLEDLDARLPDPDRISIQLQSYVQTEMIDREEDTNSGPAEPLRLFADDPQEPDESLDAHITHLVVKARHLEWKQSFATVKDHDLIVDVQPRNADGKYVELPAAMSVVVLDRNQSPENARVARWEFDAAKVATYVESGTRKGIRLALDWPGIRPDSDELFAFVRYTTIDGRKLETRCKIQPAEEEPAAVNQSNTDLTISPKSTEDWSQVAGEPGKGWTVVDIGTKTQSSKISNGSNGKQGATHATVGYEESQVSKASLSEWTRQRVSGLAGKARAAASDEQADGSPEPPKTLPSGAIQNATPIIKKSNVDKPTWKPYR